MALELKDRIYTNCVSTGTDDAWIGETKEGYQGWEAITPNATVYYCITDDTSWEVGYGEYVNAIGAGDNAEKAIKRNLLSSSTGALLNLSGNASIFLTYPSEKAVILDTDGNIQLSDANAHFKHIIGSDVTSENVVTSAIIVDGTEGLNDSNLAGLLNVYKKDEIDAQQEVQDVQIEKNKQNIVELEEEIEALAPSLDRGNWDYKEPTNPADMPAEGTYFILDDSQNITTDFANAHEILFNNKDIEDINHTWSTVEVGQSIELFDSVDKDYLLAKIEEITLESGAVKLEVTVEQSEGGVVGDSSRVRVKIFDIPEVDISSLMPKSGGTFTGEVKHKKDILIEPTMPNRFVNITNRYATNPDGSDAGTGNTTFGINFDLDYGNTGYNTVKFTNRVADILSIKGGAKPTVKYRGEIEGEHDIVNKEYVDNAIKDNVDDNNTPPLHVLTSAGNTMKYVSARSLNAGEFASVSTNMGSNKIFYFYKLYDVEGVLANASSYEATESTMLEIWTNGDLVMKTSLKDWKQSTYSSGDRQATIGGFAPITYGGNLTSNSNYGVVISGLKKKV